MLLEVRPDSSPSRCRFGHLAHRRAGQARKHQASYAYRRVQFAGDLHNPKQISPVVRKRQGHHSISGEAILGKKARGRMKPLIMHGVVVFLGLGPFQSSVPYARDPQEASDSVDGISNTRSPPVDRQVDGSSALASSLDVSFFAHSRLPWHRWIFISRSVDNETLTLAGGPAVKSTLRALTAGTAPTERAFCGDLDDPSLGRRTAGLSAYDGVKLHPVSRTVQSVCKQVKAERVRPVYALQHAQRVALAGVLLRAPQNCRSMNRSLPSCCIPKIQGHRAKDLPLSGASRTSGPVPRMHKIQNACVAYPTISVMCTMRTIVGRGGVYSVLHWAVIDGLVYSDQHPSLQRSGPVRQGRYQVGLSSQQWASLPLWHHEWRRTRSSLLDGRLRAQGSRSTQRPTIHT